MGIPKDEFAIWEPATGYFTDKPLLGLVEGFQTIGYKVFAPRDIDFLGVKFEEANESCLSNIGVPIRAIVTNPPFSVALKRGFVRHCNETFVDHGIPYALLMNTTTLVEKINGRVLMGCSVHIPFGRICFNMPSKGWGTRDNRTTATFSTNWFAKGLANTYSINYDHFNMSNHFKALDRFNDEMRGE